MAKKGFFSWFRKDKPVPEGEDQQQLDVDKQHDIATEATEQPQHAELHKQADDTARIEETERLELERLEHQRLDNERAEQARIAAERQAAEVLAAQKLATEQAEQQRLEHEQAEQARVEADRLEAARIAAERQAAEVLAAQKLAVEQAEQQRLEHEQAEQARVEADRVEAYRLEAARIAAERQAAEVLAAQKLAAEQAEQQRLEHEQAEQARIEAEHIAAQILASEALAAEQLVEQQAPIESIALEEQDEPQAKPQKEGMFARLKRGLMRTSENIGSGFIGFFRGKKIDDELFEELEEQLLIADVGVETTTKLIKSLTEHASRKQLKNAEALYDLMREEMQKMLDPVAVPLVAENANGPFVILMIGVNGVGKTTTIGKLAKQYQSQGKSVMLAAGDTFRAAAVEQLQVWGQRNNIPVVAQHTGADSASVIFDALQAAKARKVDVLIADTAGRLQNKSHLMEELKKVLRVMKKLDPDAPHEVMLTLDASTGQNAISQAQLFKEAVGVTGITISKLDGTAKGGVIFAIADKFSIPIRHIGVGEQIDDLRTFNANDFIEALFSQDKTDQ
ncbi:MULTISPECIES: signal recognition particle-docking protein FtsY [Shewanella]|uniref:signal recognition particle-docking protein FtsY n=1 Tax=Shewanella TaxID=22 RepID=UPI000C52973E|nr:MULTISPECIES: signal recognition particle-docking protein FtsY [Shewanella]NCQ44878.1 signal recognition particle-docking protein FtsY [Shewanella frigidimarina]NCO72007.1 signal recognition particle-docking protein FtsY [Shewanella vesiculosa]NCP37271.1 signal recognition particle-docking protein FtsY [Shewanella vesiculosa]NCP70633.1 signal recognition particle-docking protein FtsY [Shewanella vesiculosa]NCP74608.1 signal recognition particle-docking protein FtsY [Shewanella vesiculosa]